MDTFMDKLAQKLTAQEMIKANAAADAAELSRMREQTAEYEKLFAEMQGSSEKNAENAQKVQELVEAGIARIEKMQCESQASEELKQLLTELKEQQANLEKAQFEQLTDHVHKENVKVYRNVQAVVVDETAKQNEINGKTLSSVSKKLSAVLGISIVALLVSTAGLVFQILVYLHIL